MIEWKVRVVSDGLILEPPDVQLKTGSLVPFSRISIACLALARVSLSVTVVEIFSSMIVTLRLEAMLSEQ